MPWWEKESRHRPWIFLLDFFGDSKVLFHWFSLHSCASCVRAFFRNHPKIGAVTFHYLHIVQASVYSHLHLVTFLSQPTFKHQNIPVTSALCLKGIHIRSRWFHICAEYLRPPVFQVIFESFTPDWLTYNECFHLTPPSGQLSVRRLFLFFFFLLSLLPQKLASHSLYNFNQVYHVT